MNKLLKRYSLKHLKEEIHEYGFSYSNTDFLIEAGSIMAFIFIVAYLSQLEYRYIAVLLGFTVILIPLFIYAWFYQNYEINRFRMLVDYLSNIIPIFIQKPKIIHALKEVRELTINRMYTAVDKAILYIEDNKTDVNVYENALKIIEKEFPNSRVKSVHKMMLPIEEDNSKDYHDVLENLYVDVEGWIKRVFNFHSELKNRRNKLLILCGITLLMNCLFVYLYVSNEYFIGFTDNPMYQLSTSVFILCIMMVVAMILTKLHGRWLVNDMTASSEKHLERQYLKVKRGPLKRSIVQYLLCMIIVAYGLYVAIIKNDLKICITLLLIAYIIYKYKDMQYKSAFNSVNKALVIEFPMWLREISLSISNLTVINAIEKSKEISSLPMRDEIDKFLKSIYTDPTSIRPFIAFLDDMHVEDAKSSMKVLYSLQNISGDNIKSQISSLIIRNQEMLEKSESMRNSDSIFFVEALGFLPIIIFSIEMMVSMFLMFGHMMNQLSGVIKF